MLSFLTPLSCSPRLSSSRPVRLKMIDPDETLVELEQDPREEYWKSLWVEKVYLMYACDYLLPCNVSSTRRRPKQSEEEPHRFVMTEQMSLSRPIGQWYSYYLIHKFPTILRKTDALFKIWNMWFQRITIKKLGKAFHYTHLLDIYYSILCPGWANLTRHAAHGKYKCMYTSCHN